MRAIRIDHHQFAALVLVRLAEEHGRRDVGAHRLHAVFRRADGAVDVQAIVLAARVAVEEGRQDAQRQHGRKKQRVGHQRAADDLAQLQRQRRTFGQLAVALDLRPLRPDAGAPVDPVRLRQALAKLRHLFRRQHAGYMQHHLAILFRKNR